MGRIQAIAKTVEIFNSGHLSPYKVYVRKDLGLAVCLNPKVGSTAFRETLVEALKHTSSPPMRSKLWPMTHTRRYMTAPLSDYIDALSQQENYEFHCFVRNPYARVLSAWNDKLVKGFYAKEYPKSMRKLIPKLRRFAQERNIDGGDESKPFSFSSFITFIESQKEGQRNQHWDTQCSVLCTDKIDYQYCHRMETDFIAGITHILSKLGIDEAWTKQSLASPKNASGKIVSPIYNSELANRVYKIYQRDFERFAYDKCSWETI